MNILTELSEDWRLLMTLRRKAWTMGMNAVNYFKKRYRSCKVHRVHVQGFTSSGVKITEDAGSGLCHLVSQHQRGGALLKGPLYFSSEKQRRDENKT